MKGKLLSLAAAAVLVGPLAAHAKAITYDFTVSGGPTGPLANVTSSGWFTFDSSIIPPGRPGSVETYGLLTGLSFEWDGVSYDQATANGGWLEFSSNGTVVEGGFGTDCGEAWCAVSDGAPGWAVAGDRFYYSLGNLTDYSGSATISPRVAAAPEIDPATAASGMTLLLGGLAVLRGSRRKAKV